MAITSQDVGNQSARSPSELEPVWVGLGLPVDFLGTMIELAEHYAKLPRAQRRRTMTFFTSSAHHSPSGEQAGLRWIHNNLKSMFAKTALIVNCEHTSQVQTYLVPEPGLEAAVRAFANIVDEVNSVDLASLRAPRWSDQQR